VEQLSCPQCQAPNEPGAASCGQCGAALTIQLWDLVDPLPSASQFPRTPGEQFLPDSRAGRYIPGANVPGPQLRPTWRRMSRVEQAAGGATAIVLVSLFLPWFGLGTFSESGTGAHGYLVIVILLAVLMAGYLLTPQRLRFRQESALIVAAGAQFLMVAVGFAETPMPGLHREFGAYLALIAAGAALGVALGPAVIRRKEAP
jgi:hypothetical protein